MEIGRNTFFSNCNILTDSTSWSRSGGNGRIGHFEDVKQFNNELSKMFLINGPSFSFEICNFIEKRDKVKVVLDEAKKHFNAP